MWWKTRQILHYTEHCVKFVYSDFYHLSFLLLEKYAQLYLTNTIWYVDFVLIMSGCVCVCVCYILKDFIFSFCFSSWDNSGASWKNEHVLKFNGHVSCSIAFITFEKHARNRVCHRNRWLAFHFYVSYLSIKNTYEFGHNERIICFDYDLIFVTFSHVFETVFASNQMKIIFKTTQ